MKKYYAKEWVCGYKSTWANTGRNVVHVYSFDSKAQRDAACAEYRPPDYCPSARLEAVTSADEDVRREKRSDGGVLEWQD